jgi:hypothetical protein
MVRCEMNRKPYTSWQLWRRGLRLLIACSLVVVTSLYGDETDHKAIVIASAKAPDFAAIVKPVSTNSTYADRWVAFEQEYQVNEPSYFLVGRILQNTKYVLDWMSFEAQETAKRLEFTYEIGRPQPPVSGAFIPEPEYDLPLFGAIGSAQFKSEVNLHDPQTGAAFINLRLVIPLGHANR